MAALDSYLLVASSNKVKAFIFDQVHLAIHKGHAMPTWMRSISFKQTKLEFM